MKAYDYLIVGSALFGAIFAYFARRTGKRCLLLINDLMRAEMCIAKDRGDYCSSVWGAYSPVKLIRHLPVRFVYDNNFFNDKYQGIPEGGYNKLI